MENILKLPFKSTNNKAVIKFGFITSALIILFQFANHLVIHNYIKFDYYLSFVALFFLFIGIIINERKVVINEIPVFKSPTSKSVNSIDSLTKSELQILKFISEGKSNKEIAEINFVEISTIKTHINNLYAKLSVKNRKEAGLRYNEMLKKNSNE